jgi:hypothetical protein
LWQVFETYHAVTYFAPEARAATDALGLKGGWMGYFAARAAPLGPVPASVVAATFFNFHPKMVARSIPDAWAIAAPQQILEARVEAVDRALTRIFGHDLGSEEIREAARIARAATDDLSTAGKPLFAANAELPWPEEPHLVLWSACTRLREHRGDGHVASLVTHGLDGCEAHVTLVAAGASEADMQRTYRWWSEEEWSAAESRLQERGWLDAAGALTEEGSKGRASIEADTDDLASEPWARLGEPTTETFYRAMRGLAATIMSAGGTPVPNPMGLPWPPPEQLPVE